MKFVDSFPRAVRDIENVFIPLARGGRLAARIWLPEDAESSPVPAILEYIPYRKEKSFRLETEIEGFDGDERVLEKRFRSEVPRDLT